MRSIKNETPEQRERRLAYYRSQHAKQKARLAELRETDEPADPNSPEEQARVYREIAKLREQKRRQYQCS